MHVNLDLQIPDKKKVNATFAFSVYFENIQKQALETSTSQYDYMALCGVQGCSTWTHLQPHLFLRASKGIWVMGSVY